MAILKAIKETGSLKAAVDKSGYAYRKTWDKLKKIEERLGFKLIEKIRGCEKGVHTVLTSKGEKIVVFFDKLYDNVEPDLQKHFNNLLDELNKIVE